ncbi:MAG TPA: methyltransferase domain-containing protein, partial [Verrucomicrobiota bacterium]|nr:methyltransferase domain-containing protein [Verrucomicrobiota bacterium]
NAQIDLFWKQELALYRQAGLQDGMRVLDCGCGTGYLLHKLRGVFPNLHCTGIEVDERLVAVARRTGGGRERWQIFQHSISSLDFPDDAFDLVVARLVLEHLPDPVAALKEMRRVLRDGGKAVVIDNDFDLHERTWPDSPALGDLYEAYRRARRRDGGNPCIGRELPGLLKAAGFGSVDLSLLAAHSHVLGDAAFLKAEGSGIPAQLVKTGYLSPDTLDRIGGQWRSMLSRRHHAIFRMLFAAVGEKGAVAPALDSDLESNVTTYTASSSSGSVEPALVSVDRLRRFILETLANELKADAETLPTGESLIRSGVDSMAAMALCSRLESQFGVTLSLADVLCDSSIDDLARKVLSLAPAGDFA